MTKRIELTLPGGEEKVMLCAQTVEQQEVFADWLHALEDDPAMMAEFCTALLESELSDESGTVH